MKQPVYLFGPFVGELSWEFFRFAPFMIYKKKETPNIPAIVFTRNSSFDLYGGYADILVPLKIPNDENLTRDCFRLDSLSVKDYYHIARQFSSQYKRRFEIIKHFYPDIKYWRYKLKWQFPRRQMDYDFQARERNKQIARKLVKHNNIIIDNITEEYFKHPEAINSEDLFNKITNQITDYDSTYLGSLIESLKICRFVVGNLESHLSHLAILLKKPLICVNNKITLDKIGIMNPSKTPIIFANNIEEGIEKYDNTF
jgi:hypothetical protein